MKKVFTLFLIFLFVISLLQCGGFAQDTAQLKEKIAKIEKEIARLEKKIGTVSGASRKAQIIDLIEGHEARLEKMKKELASLDGTEEVDEATQIRNKITKIRKEIKRLMAKLTQTSIKSKRAAIMELIEGHEARIAKMEEELKILEEPVAEEMPPILEPEVMVTPEVIPEEEEKKVATSRRFEFEIGGLAGLYSAGTGIFGEGRLDLPLIYGPATTSFRIMGGFVQSEDANRRYAPVMIDGILNFPAGYFTGVENYLGAGLNYVVLTSGQRPGIIGGQIFYGVESNGFGGRLFGEIGFGILRTGFSPAHKGLNVLVGYRTKWGF